MNNFTLKSIHWFEFDLFTERLNGDIVLQVEDTQPVDWNAWRATQR